jgi:hypothetical protein
MNQAALAASASHANPGCHPGEIRRIHMASQAQINANRKNAQKSTGPITSPQVRRRFDHQKSSHPANGVIIRVHSCSFVAGSIYSHLLTRRQSQILDPNEQILVEKMAQNHGLSLRAIRLQSLVLLKTVPASYIQKDLGVLVRYQHASDRAYHKAHAEIVKAQRERGKSTIGFESEDTAQLVETVPAAQTEAPNNRSVEPQNTPNPAPQPVDFPDFTPCEVELAEMQGVSVKELMAAA